MGDVGPHIVPSVDHDVLMDVSAMTESLFPPPAKRCRRNKEKKRPEMAG